MSIFEEFSRVKAFALDVDGVLTDGSVLVTEQGEQLRRFYTKDGYAMQLAVKRGYPLVVISGGNSQGVVSRMNRLGITDVYMNCSDKIAVLEQWAATQQLPLADVLFMGDDLPDLAVLKQVGMPTCPSDAAEEIKAVCAYISPFAGGRGAVRDVFEKVLRLQQAWGEETRVKSI